MKRPTFPHPEKPRPKARSCMWPMCLMRDMVSPTLDMCIQHAKIIHDSYDRLSDAHREFAAFVNPIGGSRAIREAQGRMQAEIFEQRVLETKEPVPPTDKSGWVYYLRIDDHIKIGYTANLARRLRQYPPTAELLGVEFGTPKVEKMRHDQFAAYLALGREWFRDAPELREHISKLTRTSKPAARRGPGAAAVGRPRLRGSGRAS